MKYILLITMLLGGHVLCWSNQQNNKISKPRKEMTSSTTINFGTYYPIENFNIELPFSSEPIKSTQIKSNPILKSSTTYRAEFNYNKNFYVLGIDVYTFASLLLHPDSLQNLSTISSVSKLALSNLAECKLVNSSKSRIKGRVCLNDEFNLNISFKGMKLKQKYYSKIFNHNGFVVQLFAIAPFDEKSAYIADKFFNCVKLK